VRGRYVVIGAIFLICGAVFCPDSAHADEEEAVLVTVTPNPLTITIELYDPNAETGRPARLRTSTTNLGNANLMDVQVTLSVQPALVGSRGGFSQTHRQVNSNNQATASWSLCSNTPGNYIVMASAEVTDAVTGTFRAESTALLLEVTPGPRTCARSYEFGD
jgi:hypothetical protein